MPKGLPGLRDPCEPIVHPGILDGMQQKRVAGIVLLFLAGLVLGGVLFAARDERVQRRVAAVPAYARTYLRRLRPTPVLPTPPPVSAAGRAQLLQTRARSLPTAVPTNTPSATLVATNTSRPSSLPPTASATHPPTTTPTVTLTPFPLTPTAPELSLSGVNYTAQMWNNCGPATLAMALSYYGQQVHQREPAEFLKPNPDDKNVSPDQLRGYLEARGLEAVVRVGGTLEILQQLMSNRIPVIVEDWIEPDDLGGMGHYRLLTGYDTDEAYFIAQDSYYGPDERLYMKAFYQSWRVFNRKYIVVFRPEQRERVEAILGPYLEDDFMLAQALQNAQEAALADPADAITWFNLGTTYTQLGEPELAADAFDEARHLGLPLRMFWYQFEIFDAYLAAGRYEDVANLAYATAHSASGHEEAYYYAGLGYLGQGKNDVGISYLRKALDYNPHFQPAADALARYTE